MRKQHSTMRPMIAIMNIASRLSKLHAAGEVVSGGKRLLALR